MNFEDFSPNASDAGEEDEFRGLAAVERHFDDALVIHHGTDAGAAGFHKSRTTFHSNLVGYRAHFEDHFNGRVGIYLENDAGLHKLAEALFAHFDYIRTDRQAGQSVATIGGATHQTGCPSCCLGRADFGAWHCQAARVVDDPIDLSCGLGRDNGGARQQIKNTGFGRVLHAGLFLHLTSEARARHAAM